MVLHPDFAVLRVLARPAKRFRCRTGFLISPDGKRSALPDGDKLYPLTRARLSETQWYRDALLNPQISPAVPPHAGAIPSAETHNVGWTSQFWKSGESRTHTHSKTDSTRTGCTRRGGTGLPAS